MRRLLILGVLLALGVAGSARAELLEDTVRAQQVPLIYGAGTTRLDGMGLTIAPRDENNEINLFDYGDNPAGLLTDRDAWSVDFRTAHQERIDRDPRLPGFYFRGNTYSFLAAYRRTSFQAVAAGIDYVESKVGEPGEGRFSFKNSQYRLLYNRLFGPVSTGVEFRYRREVEDRSQSDDFYAIEHTTDSFTGVVGVSYDVGTYATLAGRGELRTATVDGVARSDAFRDEFTWDRPDGSAYAQAFVHLPRVQGAAVLGRFDGAGQEDLQAGWSPLFIFNPGNRFIRFSETTFTEKFSRDEFRTRWQYDAIPDLLSLSASYARNRFESSTVIQRSVRGSRDGGSFNFDQNDFRAGGGLVLLDQRLFLGSEISQYDQTYTDNDILTGFEETVKVTGIQVGGEYLVGERLAARTGFGFRNEDRGASSIAPRVDPPVTGSFKATKASFGLGYVPAGGIFQLDAAYAVDLHSDLKIDQDTFSIYGRLLF